MTSFCLSSGAVYVSHDSKITSLCAGESCRGQIDLPVGALIAKGLMTVMCRYVKQERDIFGNE